jgi:hypothetical protein
LPWTQCLGLPADTKASFSHNHRFFKAVRCHGPCSRMAIQISQAVHESNRYDRIFRGSVR